MTEHVEELFQRVVMILAEADAATNIEQFQALISQIPGNGPPTHTDLLEDDERPGQYWQHTYPMNPVITDGIITAWECDGCGYEQVAATDPGAHPRLHS